MYFTGNPYGAADPVFDSASFAAPKPKEQGYVIPEAILDAASDDLGEKQLRANAMAAVLAWLEDNDYSYEALDAIVAGLSDLDDDGEITEPEEDLFNDLLVMVADVLATLGGEEANIKSFIDDESEDAGEKLAAYLNKKLEANDKSDDELITEYAVKAQLVLDATQKVVRNGKVKLIKKRTKKRRMSAKQKAALKKARRKANNSGARRERAKSMKKRQQSNM
ncbi:hypothetical protein [Vibrio sp.]|uniref:hypothetical protein n=1 Tax=Vibrio sp. TaxID=678 RepID=UPI0037B60590